ncbi:MAG TPA: YdiU family protein [Alphaproteobacteria bacterium]|nr:YdiU family protein [Alphaproteobacteria bacterium]
MTALTMPFDNSYARLPERFFAHHEVAPVASPRLIKLNHRLCRVLGLDPAQMESADAVAMLAGHRFPDAASPIAMAYAGHQFGHFVPQLGDGRAVLVGEILAPEGRRFDLHLKGSGPTAFSRRGDGRAALGPVLREYIISEAMSAFGIPTTLSLAAVATGEPVYRETALPGAVLARVATSHIRVGTFQYFAARQDTDALRLLAGYAIARLYPHLAQEAEPYVAFLEAVIAAQARLIAQWMSVGFVHGVMNTDNMSVAGETIDYGPCAFLDTYDPAAVFSSIDQHGRYAFANQPHIAQWNLTRLAETLLPLLDADETRAIGKAEAALAQFAPLFNEHFRALFAAKIGLTTHRPSDIDLIQRLLKAMHEGQADFTLTFRALAGALTQGGEPGLLSLFANTYGISQWLPDWRARLDQENRSKDDIAAAMRAANPAIIPRNHKVEHALAAATEGDLAPFEDLLRALETPYTDDTRLSPWTMPPMAHERVTRTFCGT